MIVVSAGFFNASPRGYEVFWERRRFSWGFGGVISASEADSVDANRLREDVYPDAPWIVPFAEVEIGSWSAATSSTRSADGSSVHASSLQSSSLGTWAEGDDSSELGGTTPEAGDASGSSWPMRSSEGAGLLALPPPPAGHSASAAATVPSLGDLPTGDPALPPVSQGQPNVASRSVPAAWRERDGNIAAPAPTSGGSSIGGPSASRGFRHSSQAAA
mmetsp:Transcript_119695/g.343864  ORF Transcript_119695/g.343864 Transcript_119695/m.343864 type:complete len:217 (-) Transcript_119695:61-711(-)